EQGAHAPDDVPRPNAGGQGRRGEGGGQHGEAGESPNGKDHAEQSQRRQDLGPRIEPVDGGVHRDVLAEDEPLKELHGSGLAPAAPRGWRSALRPPSGYRAGPAARAPAAAGPAAPSAAPQARGPGAEP